MPRTTPSLSCRELLPVCCAESYSRAVVPRATPELLCQELLPVYPAESYSRFGVPRTTPELLCHELLPSCCAESYSQSIVMILVLTMRWMSLPSVQNAVSEAPKHTHKTNSKQADISKVVLCSEAHLLDFSEAGGEQLQARSIWPAAASRSS